MNQKMKKVLVSVLLAVTILCAAVVGVVVYQQTHKGGSPEIEKVWDGVTKIAPTGSGTEQDPYIISRPAHLAYVATEIEDYQENTYYSITEDLDMGKYEWFSIGSASNPFSGVVNANQHNVFRIGSDAVDYYSDKASQSLFGYIENAEINDLFVVYTGVQLNKQADWGGIATWAKNSTINRSANLTATLLIDNNETNTIGNNYGGLIATAEGGVAINNSYNMTTLSYAGVGNAIGGLIGEVKGENNLIKNSFNAGEIIAQDITNLGMIIGLDSENVEMENTISQFGTSGDIATTDADWQTFVTNSKI